MKKLFVVPAVFLFGLFFCSNAFAWGPYAHTFVGEQKISEASVFLKAHKPDASLDLPYYKAGLIGPDMGWLQSITFGGWIPPLNWVTKPEYHLTTNALTLLNKSVDSNNTKLISFALGWLAHLDADRAFNETQNELNVNLNQGMNLRMAIEIVSYSDPAYGNQNLSISYGDAVGFVPIFKSSDVRNLLYGVFFEGSSEYDGRVDVYSLFLGEVKRFVESGVYGGCPLMPSNTNTYDKIKQMNVTGFSPSTCDNWGSRLNNQNLLAGELISAYFEKSKSFIAQSFNDKTPKCSDGTVFFQCSQAKPQYCDQGNPVDNCQACGCPTGKQCNVGNGACKTQPIPQVCPDGTLFGNCSALLPKYCLNGSLTDNCQLCGCPNGKQCNSSNGTCETPATPENCPDVCHPYSPSSWLTNGFPSSGCSGTGTMLVNGCCYKIENCASGKNCLNGKCEIISSCDSIKVPGPKYSNGTCNLGNQCNGNMRLSGNKGVNCKEGETCYAANNCFFGYCSVCAYGCSGGRCDDAGGSEWDTTPYHFENMGASIPQEYQYNRELLRKGSAGVTSFTLDPLAAYADDRIVKVKYSCKFGIYGGNPNSKGDLYFSCYNNGSSTTINPARSPADLNCEKLVTNVKAYCKYGTYCRSTDYYAYCNLNYKFTNPKNVLIPFKAQTVYSKFDCATMDDLYAGVHRTSDGRLFVYRSHLQFDISKLKGKKIKNAKLSIKFRENLNSGLATFKVDSVKNVCLLGCSLLNAGEPRNEYWSGWNNCTISTAGEIDSGKDVLVDVSPDLQQAIDGDSNVFTLLFGPKSESSERVDKYFDFVSGEGPKITYEIYNLPCSHPPASYPSCTGTILSLCPTATNQTSCRATYEYYAPDNAFIQCMWNDVFNYCQWSTRCQPAC